MEGRPRGAYDGQGIMGGGMLMLKATSGTVAPCFSVKGRMLSCRGPDLTVHFRPCCVHCQEQLLITALH